MVLWWNLWEGIIEEYWLGTWHMSAADLGGELAASMAFSGDGGLSIVVDASLLQVFSEEDQLTEISKILRRLMANRAPWATPGTVVNFPLTPYWQHRRNLWLGPPQGSSSLS